MIDYLNKGKEEKETCKAFIGYSRAILMSQISINDKKEESERLKEYITMEQEKLDEARKFLAEDKQKFSQMMADS